MYFVFVVFSVNITEPNAFVSMYILCICLIFLHYLILLLLLSMLFCRESGMHGMLVLCVICSW